MSNYRVRSVFRTYRKGILMFVQAILLSSVISYGQVPREEAPPLKERLFFGGSFALTLGTLTNIEIAPVAGLWVLPRINVALGPTYRYYKYREDKTDIIGGRAYFEFVFLREMDKLIPLGSHTSLFIHIEDEMLSLSSRYWANVTLSPKRFIINTVLVGPGLSQQLGQKASLNIAVLWALNDSGYNVYSNPEIKIGFTF